ncbi:MAG: transporter substrate-binding domain-containing protein [Sporomusaceae bacterium]|nr:transporter substrate-binding domain-containing protein [Sporomusaceae bacterium]
MIKKRMICFFAIVVIGIISLAAAGCGSQSNGADSSKVKTYYVATRGTYKPYTYMDEKNNLTGFDIEILKEIEKRNPDIKFDYKLMSLESAFVALEAKQIDIIANQMVHNSDRDTKYLFTKEANNLKDNQIVIKESRNDIQTLDDLRGKTVALVPTSPSYRDLKKYNETAEPQIKFLLTDKGASETLNMVATGRADASIDNRITVKEANATLNYGLKAIGENLTPVPTFYILRKDAESAKLADRIDAALRDMKKDGTLKALSEKFLEGDFTIPSEIK